MKYLIIILCFISFPVFGSDWSLEGKTGQYFPTDKEIQNGHFAQINLIRQDIYIFGSLINSERRLGGQRAGEIDIYGIGLGIKFPISKYVKFWGQVGYYIPDSQMSGTMQFEESQWLNWRDWGQRFAYNGVIPLRIYSYDIQSNFGGAIGLEGQRPLTKHLSIGMDVGYNFLQFIETFKAIHPNVAQNGSWIETRQDKNFGGATLGLKISYKF